MDVISHLCSTQKLNRDRGVIELNKLLPQADCETYESLKKELTQILKDDTANWESKQGALSGSKALLLHRANEDVGLVPNEGKWMAEFSDMLLTRALELLSDAEVRVRLAAGEVLGTLCQVIGVQVYMSSKEFVLELVKSNVERQPLSDMEDEVEEVTITDSGEKPVRRRRNSSDAAKIFHDTAGWKSLETSMKCLQACIEGCGHRFNPCVDQALLDLVFSVLKHTNRFVRETGYQVCAALVSVGVGTDGVTLKTDNAVYQHGDQFADYLALGLADNWSQVRLAASIATRKFMLSLPGEKERELFFPKLLPKMCLNRYYVAEGVRIYSQETWRQIAHTQGCYLVEKYIADVQEYYIAQTKADNHAVREAACACIAELGSKIKQDAVRPFVPPLLDALLVCFNDDSWPVRDAACLACGNFIFCFPDESKPYLCQLYPLFFSNLSDVIPSVRQGAASALANIVRVYKCEAIEKVICKITEGLENVKMQEETQEKYGGLEKGPATFGVAKRARDNDPELHSNQLMYSCGSLAPKMRAGGCMDHQFRRPPEPWEVGDGCVHMMAELASISECSKEVFDLLPVLAKASGLHHYHQHYVFLESLCKQLPIIAKGVGKKIFKTHLELFLDPVFYALSCDNALASSAASTCLNELSKLLGPSILRARVENFNPKYLEPFDANTYISSY
ncbi:PREDICTED: uncharacterized protein LOC106812561 [Priapulus caudatus]|uniref:Uncharacterized protein LOC106812561 n=1 Tax=Priapulus caudatus TaxID=37621 RepID=A0ABM1EIC6_PRICU|nr:PREDICTED: uncharacterized protein LOC106812561 [Priapulus caudatus]